MVFFQKKRISIVNYAKFLRKRYRFHSALRQKASLFVVVEKDSIKSIYGERDKEIWR